jgi:hypothetical protein
LDTVTWQNRDVPFISPDLQCAVYLEIIAQSGYGKPATDWRQHQQATLAPTAVTAGTIYTGALGAHSWTYTAVTGETSTTACAHIAAAIQALALEGVSATVITGPKVLVDVPVGTTYTITVNNKITLAESVNLQQALIKRGRITLQVKVVSLESTDVSWAIYYLDNMAHNIWSNYSLDFIRGLGLGLISVSDAITHDVAIDDRMASVGTCDVKFSYVDTFLVPVDVGTIEHVSGLAKVPVGATIEQVLFQADKPVP